jgi:amino acid transporter
VKIKPLSRKPSSISTPAAARLGGQQIGLLALVAVMYLAISGGAYGIEEAVRWGGIRLTLLLCLLVALTVSLPTALMAAELTTLFPVEGGFYVWVREGLGSFAGFAEAYFTLLYTAVDMTLYPVLFASYLAFIWPLSAAAQLGLALLMVWSCGLLNIAGVKLVGRASIGLCALLLAPLLAMVVAGGGLLLKHPLPPPGASLPGGTYHALGMALVVVIWNFSGWENLSVVAQEIKTARRSYLVAMAIVLPMVVLGYLLPVAVGGAVMGNPAAWHGGALAEVGQRLGGRLLGHALALGGMVSALAIFQAAMLWVSRLPFILALEGYLPSGLSRLSERTLAPWVAIVAWCVVCTLLLPLGFAVLVLLDVTFYMAGLMLELAALIRLRRLRPQRPGLFTIPGGVGVLALLTIAPLVVWALTFTVALGSTHGLLQLSGAAMLGLSAWPVYRLCQRGERTRVGAVYKPSVLS